MLAHLNNPKTQHWKVFEIIVNGLQNSVDLSGIKDYNDIVKLEKKGFSYNIKSSIQAKIYIKSKL